MRETTFTELRNQAKRFFDLVEAGETVRVLRKWQADCRDSTDRGRRALVETAQGAPALPEWRRDQQTDPGRTRKVMRVYFDTSAFAKCEAFAEFSHVYRIGADCQLRVKVDLPRRRTPAKRASTLRAGSRFASLRCPASASLTT